MRNWAALAVGLALLGYLGYRVLRLEQRIDALAERLGAAPAAGGNAGAGGGYEQRLSTLEADQRQLHDDLRTLELATADPMAARRAPSQRAGMPDPASGDQRILSVLGRAQTRILERQLEFHHARWLDQREAALDQFAASYKLSPRQTDQLHQLLADELDRMIEIMRQPDAAENPERVADDWFAALATTDGAARRLLDPAQVAAWDTARMLERRILWPWLPDR